MDHSLSHQDNIPHGESAHHSRQEWVYWSTHHTGT